MKIILWLRNLLGRVRLAWRVLRQGLPSECAPAVGDVLGGARRDRFERAPESQARTQHDLVDLLSGKRTPGLNCPKCGELIAVTIPDLLARRAVQCSGCGLKLNVDWQEDPKARLALQNLQAAAAQVERARSFRG